MNFKFFFLIAWITQSTYFSLWKIMHENQNKKKKKKKHDGMENKRRKKNKLTSIYLWKSQFSSYSFGISVYDTHTQCNFHWYPTFLVVIVNMPKFNVRWWDTRNKRNKDTDKVNLVAPIVNFMKPTNVMKNTVGWNNWFFDTPHHQFSFFSLQCISLFFLQLSKSRCAFFLLSFTCKNVIEKKKTIYIVKQYFR